MKLVGSTGSGKHSPKQDDHVEAKKDKVFGGENTAFPNVIETEINSSKLGGETAAKKQKPKRSKKKTALIVLVAIAVFIGVCAAVYFIWEKPLEVVAEGPRLQNTPLVDGMEGRPGHTPPTEQEEEEPTTGRKKDCYTFLIMAVDEGGTNTDAIFVGRFDIKEGTLDIVSIPRDTIMNVSWATKRINTVYFVRGNDPDKFIDTLADLTGFEVDCYAVMDLKMIAELVDCIGGITYNVPVNMSYSDPAQNLYINFSAGEQMLSGADAVKVMRYRSYPNGDIGRIAVQQDMMKTLMTQMLSLSNIPNVDDAIKIFGENVTTNLTANNIGHFVRSFLALNRDNINFHTLPGWSNMIGGASYYITYVDEWLEIVNEHLNPFHEEITRAHVDIMQYSSSYGMYGTAGN